MEKLEIKFLPPSFTDTELIDLLILNNKVTDKLRILDVKMNRELVSYELLNSFTMREAVESTRIEGTQTTISEVYEAHILGDDSVLSTIDTREVVNYINALHHGFELIQKDGFIAGRTLKEIHRVLLKGDVRGKDRSPGEFRKVDNWIGPEGASKEKASYIPPSHIDLPEHIKNLEKYINDINNEIDKLPYLIRGAIIHAQFESIHPFLDGNGRVGRILIPLYFKLNGDKTLSSIFISSQLEKSKFKYYALLNGTRKEIPKWPDWVSYFLDATLMAVEEASDKYDRLIDLYNRTSDVSDPNYMKILDLLFRSPIITIPSAALETGLSRPTVARILEKMMDRKIVFPNDAIRNTKYFFYDLISTIE